MHRRHALTTLAAIGLGGSAVLGQQDPGGNNPRLPARLPDLPGPDPIPEVPLGPTLPTIPVRRGSAGPSWVVVDSSPLPLDREGIWILDFAFKPVRMVSVELPGKGKRDVHYMYYRVINRTGKPRMFVPQFSLVTDQGKRYDDVVLPQAVKNVQAREDPTKALLGAVTVMGMIPPSTKEGVDDAVFGVAVWDTVDFQADSFKVYIRGLSDGFQTVKPPDEGKPFNRYKALRVDFNRPGDDRKPNEREIHLLDPPYEWIYYP